MLLPDIALERQDKRPHSLLDFKLSDRYCCLPAQHVENIDLLLQERQGLLKCLHVFNFSVGFNFFPGDGIIAAGDGAQFGRSFTGDGFHNFGNVIMAGGDKVAESFLGAAYGRARGK